jgi:hypothetical protein
LEFGGIFRKPLESQIYQSSFHKFFRAKEWKMFDFQVDFVGGNSNNIVALVGKANKRA